ncbi:MAG: histidinol dehydrogenase [Clostridia bacterium]|nr:histidinol dehydrogenase [Clostridia bacterium]
MIKILKYGEVKESEIFSRVVPKVDVRAIVADIIADVKENGDKALYKYALKFDKAELSSLRVSNEEIEEAVRVTGEEFLSVLKEAAENITLFHSKQKREGFKIEKENGVVIGQKVLPVNCAGLYVPGGTAAYPSTVLMDAIPAKIAGCKNVVMVTPPSADGKVNPAILAAASVAGVDKIFKVGGAQAVAALAFGTESIPKADKIVGPGNAFVAEAKRQVFGEVSIDMIAGPSEIMILADGKNDPSYLAADMLSQAEHDKLATAVMITDSAVLAKAVAEEIEKQLPSLLRCDIAREAIDNNSKIIVTDDLASAVDLANDIAPEHLELCLDEPFEMLEKIENAGSVFLGRNCPEALGDYFAGPNHTLPTSGTAKFSSPLSVDDFVKKMQFTYFTKEALDEVADKVAAFAEKEGLTAHARSAVIRSEDKNE